MFKKLLLIFGIIVCFIYVPLVNAAINITQPPGTGLRAENTGEATLQTLINNLVTIIFSISAIALLFMLLWGAFNWIISRGEKENISKARSTITHALIGFVILALSFVIVSIAGQILGVNTLNNLQFPTLGPGESKN